MSRYWPALTWAAMAVAGGVLVLAAMAAGLILMVLTP